jgi:Mrp family chromosome partitioning ATPase
MSNIDQAFINAYADQPATTVPIPQSTYTVRAPGPTLRVFSQAVERESAEHRIDQPQRGVSALHPPRVGKAFQSTYAEVAAQQQSGLDDADELTLPSLISERKPLSTFAAPKSTPTAAFKPVFEVDEFRWPAITSELITTSRTLFLPITEMLFAAADDGRTLVGIAGANSRVGTSTVTMCLARLFAESGRNVALVDGNFVHGDLARTLGLEFDLGWEDVLAGKMPLAECAVASLTDKMTLVPIGGPAETEIGRLTSIQSSVIAGMLRYHYDLVLFDLGSASNPTQLSAITGVVEHCRLDAGIVVATVGARDPITIHGIDQFGAVFGPSFLGVVGNRAC